MEMSKPKELGSIESIPLMAILQKILVTYDIHESCSKDVANLLHAQGNTEALMKTIATMNSPWRMSRVYSEILSHLKAMQGKPIAPISSRVVYVEFPSSLGQIHLEPLKAIFPNMSKVWRVLLSQTGSSALLEFASHSSARRAVDARQQAQTAASMQPASDQVKCAWVSPYVVIKPMDLSQLKSFPIIEIVDDDSIVCPSTDWRRPRPTNIPTKPLESFTTRDLVSVLNMAGAFDDYPADVCQIVI